MEWVETTGKTVDEAKEAALDQLGVDESDAEFVTVSEPKAGLFGRMRGEARVRARVRPTAPRPKRGRSRRSGEETRRANGSRGGRGGRSGEGASRQGQKATTLAVDDDTEAGPGGGNSLETVAASTGGSGGGGTGTGTGTRKRRRRGGRGRSGGSTASGGAGASAAGENGSARPQRASGNGAGGRARPANKGNEEETVEQVLTLEEQGESARRFVEGVVREMGLSADVGVRLVDEDTAEVTVGGEELGLLIGPGGATLSALQEVTRTVVQKHTGGHSDRIIVDVAGYRAKRAEALAKFSRKVAEEVAAAGEERALEPMSPPDRKVVHDTVNEIEGVATRSEGEEPRRYVVISPTATVSAAAPAEVAEAATPDED
jgi:spoIIIJ-associated protein